MLFTLFAVFTILFIALQRKKQYSYQIEKQEREHRFATELMQSRLEVHEQTLKDISGELHDNIAQILGIAKMKMHVLADNGNNNAVATEVAGMIGHAIQDVRNLSHVLNGTFIMKGGLKAAIDKDLERISSSTGILAACTAAGPLVGISDDKELILFRIVQESVANAVKHGRPASVQVGLNGRANTLDISIDDDGQGFDPSAASMGMGLESIRERVKLLGGTISILSSPGKGTNIHLSIPIQV